MCHQRNNGPPDRDGERCRGPRLCTTETVLGPEHCPVERRRRHSRRWTDLRRRGLPAGVLPVMNDWIHDRTAPRMPNDTSRRSNKIWYIIFNLYALFGLKFSCITVLVLNPNVGWHEYAYLCASLLSVGPYHRRASVLFVAVVCLLNCQTNCWFASC